MIFSFMVVAYLGPETMLPMTSVVAGVAGVVMLFGRNAMRRVSGIFRKLMTPAASRSKATTRIKKIGTGPVGSIERPRSRSRA